MRNFFKINKMRLYHQLKKRRWTKQDKYLSPWGFFAWQLWKRSLKTHFILLEEGDLLLWRRPSEVFRMYRDVFVVPNDYIRFLRKSTSALCLHLPTYRHGPRWINWYPNRLCNLDELSYPLKRSWFYFSWTVYGSKYIFVDTVKS